MTVILTKAVLKGHLFGLVETRNIFTAEVILGNGDTLDDIWKGYLDEIITAIRSWLSTAWTNDTLETFIWDINHWQPQEETVYNWVGLGSGDALANLVASVFIGKTLHLRTVGRKFFSGLIESGVAGNSLTGNAVAAFAAACAAYISVWTSSNNGTVTPGVVAKNGTFYRFTSGFVSSLLGTMRRRKPGLGV